MLELKVTIKKCDSCLCFYCQCPSSPTLMAFKPMSLNSTAGVTFWKPCITMSFHCSVIISVSRKKSKFFNIILKHPTYLSMSISTIQSYKSCASTQTVTTVLWICNSFSCFCLRLIGSIYHKQVTNMCWLLSKQHYTDNCRWKERKGSFSIF